MEHETNQQKNNITKWNMKQINRKNNITKWNMKQINRKIILLNGT